MQAEINHLQAMARAYDRGWYAMSLFLPEVKRFVFWAALTVQAELTHIPQVTTTADTALLRCVWWRDRLSALFAGESALAHPTLKALEAMRGQLGNAEPWLSMVNAFAGWFTEEAPKDWQEVERFAENFYGPLAEILQGDKSDALKECMVAYGLLKERERMALALAMPRPERLPMAFLTGLQEARSAKAVVALAEQELVILIQMAEKRIFNTNHPVKERGVPSDDTIRLNKYTANKKLSFHKLCKFNELSYKSSRYTLGLLGGLYWKRLLRKF